MNKAAMKNLKPNSSKASRLSKAFLVNRKEKPKITADPAAARYGAASTHLRFTDATHSLRFLEGSNSPLRRPCLQRKGSWNSFVK